MKKCTKTKTYKDNSTDCFCEKCIKEFLKSNNII